MFGSSPGIFRNLEAIKNVVKGFEKEEKEKWFVTFKMVEHSKKPWYRACRESDLKMAREDGYTVITRGNKYAELKASITKKNKNSIY